MKSESTGVQSIEVGLALLKPLLDAGGPLTLKAIADAAGFAPPKAHRYLVSLMRSGLIERHLASSRYALGPLALQLGFAALGMIDQDALGRHAVEELAIEAGVTCCTVAWVNEMAVITSVELGLGTIFTGVKLGTQLSLWNSASGQVLLSYLPRELTARALAAELARHRVTKAEVTRAITTIRHNGISTIEDIVMPGMGGLAVPVFAHTGSIIYTLTMLGPMRKFDFGANGTLAHMAKVKAADLSSRLGYKG